MIKIFLFSRFFYLFLPLILVAVHVVTPVVGVFVAADSRSNVAHQPITLSSYTIELSSIRPSSSPILLTPSSTEFKFWDWNKEDYPDPQENPKFCHRTVPSLLCDPDFVLSAYQGKC